MDVARAQPPQSVSHPTWQTWGALPWLTRGSSGVTEAQLAMGLLESAVRAESAAAYLRQELPEIASEFAAQWIAVFQRGANWDRLSEFGRQPIEALPLRFF